MNKSFSHWTAGLYILAVVGLTGCGSTRSDVQLHALETDRVLDDALVIVIDDPRSERRRSGLTGPAYNSRLAYHEDPILHRYASRIANDYSLKIMSEWPVKNLGVHCFVVEKSNLSVRDQLERDERVLWVQPFNEFELKGDVSGETEVSSARLRQSFQEAFEARGRSIRVAVVDTAADKNHPDLRNASLIVSNFSGNRGQPNSEIHGTAVVGLIAANPVSERGARGIASEAKTHLLRGCWQDGSAKGRCNTLTLALALDAAIDIKPDIINLSLTGGRDRVLDALIDKLTRQGTLVVAAFDEKRETSQRFPAPGPGVIYAYGLDQREQDYPRSQNVLVAPRHAVSLAPMSGYDLISGHSIAAPQLTAMAAVLMETYADDQRSDTVERLNAWVLRHVTVQGRVVSKRPNRDKRRVFQ